MTPVYDENGAPWGGEDYATRVLVHAREHVPRDCSFEVVSLDGEPLCGVYRDSDRTIHRVTARLWSRVPGRKERPL